MITTYSNVHNSPFQRGTKGDFIANPKLIGFDLNLGRILMPGERAVIKVTWLGDLEKTEVSWGGLSYPKNLPLPKGEYIVEFEHMLETPKFDNFKVQVLLDFEVN